MGGTILQVQQRPVGARELRASGGQQKNTGIQLLLRRNIRIMRALSRIAMITVEENEC